MINQSFQVFARVPGHEYLNYVTETVSGIRAVTRAFEELRDGATEVEIHSDGALFIVPLLASHEAQQ